jgi:phage FluMu gp28-like protein
MNFSALFGFGKKLPKPSPACHNLILPPSAACDSLPQSGAEACHNLPVNQPIVTVPNLILPAVSEILFSNEPWFLPTQAAWVTDPWPLKIMEKSRQVGITITDAFDSVMKASPAGAKFDVWVSSRDEIQARLYLEDCKEWAKILNLAVTDLGLLLLDPKNNFSAYVLQFANGRRIYCLSSNPNAFAGKRGHVKIDEFALHQDQRLLYRIAKAVTQWGGTFSIFSTHRGPSTLFNEIIGDIRHNGNPMNWHLYSYPIHKAVEEGIVERINQKSGRNETREEFLARIHAQCIDEEQWKQEYCCIPADESSAFLSHELITGCEDHTVRLMPLEHLLNYMADHPNSVFYLGMDVARRTDLCVIDVGEKIGDVIWDRCRIELKGKPYSEIKSNLNPILAMPNLQRACIDARNLGNQLAEEARDQFGWKVEPLDITAPLKEQLAFGLRRDFEDRKLRIPCDDKLRADLRGLKKLVTPSGNIRFDGESDDSHCDRTWAMAYRQYAARTLPEIGAMCG